MAAQQRGLFILLEGCDKSGKTTQVARLAHRLRNSPLCGGNGDVEEWHFPRRDTDTGRVLDAYLRGELKLDTRAVHLLFSANRWESNEQLRQTLLDGTTVVMDRYAHSGVAYSRGAHKLPLEWCLASDRGLVAPDVMILLSDKWAPQCGEEIYEIDDVQARVRCAFEEFACSAAPRSEEVSYEVHVLDPRSAMTTETRIWRIVLSMLQERQMATTKGDMPLKTLDW